MVPDHKDDVLELAIDRMSQEKADFAESIVTPAQISALRDDTEHMIRYTINYNCYIRGYDYEQLAKGDSSEKVLSFSNDKHRKHYNLNKDRADRLLQFLHKIKEHNLANEELVEVDHLQNAIIACVRSMKAIKNIRHNIQSL